MALFDLAFLNKENKVYCWWIYSGVNELVCETTGYAWTTGPTTGNNYVRGFKKPSPLGTIAYWNAEQHSREGNSKYRTDSYTWELLGCKASLHTDWELKVCQSDNDSAVLRVKPNLALRGLPTHYSGCIVKILILFLFTVLQCSQWVPLHGCMVMCPAVKKCSQMGPRLLQSLKWGTKRRDNNNGSGLNYAF